MLYTQTKKVIQTPVSIIYSQVSHCHCSRLLPLFTVSTLYAVNSKARKRKLEEDLENSFYSKQTLPLSMSMELRDIGELLHINTSTDQ